jgi:hypothetical protein
MQMTERMLRFPEVMRCMSHFPVVIKSSHLRALREYVESVHGQPFERVFWQLCNMSCKYAQFNAMCNFVWMFHRGEYEWRFQEMKPGWRWELEPVPGMVDDAQLDDILDKPQWTMPWARVAIHWYHVSSWQTIDENFPYLTQHRRGKRWELIEVLAEGLCLSNNDTTSEHCKRMGKFTTHCSRDPDSAECAREIRALGCAGLPQNTTCDHNATAPQWLMPYPRAYSRAELQHSLFAFEGYSWAWDPRCEEAQRVHFGKIEAELPAKAQAGYCNNVERLFVSDRKDERMSVAISNDVHVDRHQHTCEGLADTDKGAKGKCQEQGFTLQDALAYLSWLDSKMLGNISKKSSPSEASMMHVILGQGKVTKQQTHLDEGFARQVASIDSVAL